MDTTTLDTIIDSLQESLKHECRAFGAIKALNTLRITLRSRGLLTDEVSLVMAELEAKTDKPEFFKLEAFDIFKKRKPQYECPRCKWSGVDDDLKPVNPKGEHEDGAEPFTLYCCPKCGEHKLTEL